MESSEITETYLDHILNNVTNIYAFITACVVLVGLIGNSVIILMFVQKKLRSNPSHCYLLCAAINDNCVLIIHFVEKFLNHYPETDNFDFLVKSNFSCKLLTYLKNLFRFNSSFIVIAFTLQRLYVVHRPLNTNWKTKKLAWKLVSLILMSSSVLNLWVPFFIEWQNNHNCNILNEMRFGYFVLNVINVFIVIVIPSVIICVSNGLIIRKTKQTNLNRIRLTQLNPAIATVTATTARSSFTAINTVNLIRLPDLNGNSLSLLNEQTIKNIRIKPHYWTSQQIANKKINIQQASVKMTKNLIFISFSFVMLNIPYSIMWTIYYSYHFFESFSISSHEILLNARELTEILFMLNYGTKFFILWLTGTLFRRMLKNLKSKFLVLCSNVSIA